MNDRLDEIQTKLFEGNWKIRRRVLFLTLAYIAGSVTYIIWQGTDTALYQQIAISMIAAGTAIIGSYVFGAVWDDSNKRAAMQQTRKGPHWGPFRDHHAGSVADDCPDPPTRAPSAPRRYPYNNEMK